MYVHKSVYYYASGSFSLTQKQKTAKSSSVDVRNLYNLIIMPVSFIFTACSRSRLSLSSFSPAVLRLLRPQPHSRPTHAAATLLQRPRRTGDTEASSREQREGRGGEDRERRTGEIG